jgi:ribosomal protein S18 acetylase RimI-like enzyme
MISIKQATVSDAALISEIGIQSFIESHGNSASTENITAYIALKFNKEVLIEELNDPKNIFHILYFNDEPAGYSKIIFNDPHEAIEDKNVTKLERLYLLESFYGKGLGTILFDFIIGLSKKEKQAGIWLQVWTENKRAIAFYKKSGFVVKAETFFKISETHSNPNHLMYDRFDD